MSVNSIAHAEFELKPPPSVSSGKKSKGIFGIFKIFKKKKKRNTRQRSVPNQNNYEKPIELVEKNENARQVYVFGGKFSEFLFKGLQETFASDPNFAIIQEKGMAAGLLDPDSNDWPSQLETRLAAAPVDVAILMFGSSDNRAISSEQSQEAEIAFDTAEWVKEYNQRLEELAEILIKSGKPILWLGLPPVRSSELQNSLASINLLHSSIASSVGLAYVDIWDAFLDDNGRFSDYGSDIDGVRAKLRLSNGVGFTQKGRLKLALFLKNEILYRFGDGSTQASRFAGVFKPERGAEGKMGTPVFLNRPTTSVNSSTLDGAVPGPAHLSPETSAYRLLVLGDPVSPVSGRIDDYTWNP